MPFVISDTFMDFSFSSKLNYITCKKLELLVNELESVPESIKRLEVKLINTLFDENASCHFAIGSAYKTCIKNGDDIKDEELDKYGVNNSLTHVDFMIGSNDMNIVGITHQGEEVQVFKDGNWAF